MYRAVELDNVLAIEKIYTAFGKKYDSSYYFEGEAHDFWEIVIVVDGEIGVTAGSDLFMLKKGQAIIHEPMEFHRLWSEGSTSPELVIFSFAAKNVPEYSAKIFEIADIARPKKILEEMQNSFDGGEYKLTGISDNIRSQIAIKKLEMFLIETISQKLAEAVNVKSRAAENYATIVTLLENNLDKNFSVADIAKMCNMSEINLKKTFSKYSGIGVIKYFNRLKVTAATEMIKNGMSVAETAAALGFANQNYFSTVFRRVAGNPPSFYKINNSGGSKLW